MQYRSVRRVLACLLALTATSALLGCASKGEINQASPPLTPSETARNEPAPKNDDGTPKTVTNTNNEPGGAGAPAGPGEIVGRDRPTTPGGQ